MFTLPSFATALLGRSRFSAATRRSAEAESLAGRQLGFMEPDPELLADCHEGTLCAAPGVQGCAPIEN